MRQAFAKPDARQQATRRGHRVFTFGRPAGQFEGQQYVFQSRQVWQQLERLEHESDRACAQSRAPVLIEREHVLAEDADLAGGRNIEARQ